MATTGAELDPEYADFQQNTLFKLHVDNPLAKPRPGRNVEQQNKCKREIRQIKSDWWDTIRTRTRRDLIRFLNAHAGAMKRIGSLVMIGLGSLINEGTFQYMTNDVPNQPGVIHHHYRLAYVVLFLDMAREVRRWQDTFPIHLYASDPDFTADDAELLGHWGIRTLSTSEINERIDDWTILYAPWSFSAWPRIRNAVLDKTLEPSLLLHAPIGLKVDREELRRSLNRVYYSGGTIEGLASRPNRPPTPDRDDPDFLHRVHQKAIEGLEIWTKTEREHEVDTNPLPRYN